MRTQIAAANWKMNLTLSEAIKLTEEICQQPLALTPHQRVLLAVPFPYLLPVKNILGNQKQILVTAQNVAATPNGAFTGEVSAEMLKSLQVDYALIGHSERREYHHEDSAILAAKVDRCLANNVTPVFCCGEPLPVREAGSQNDYVETQLKDSLFHLPAEMINGFIIAYEPIWAIGTGKTASSKQAEDMHAHIRNVFSKHYGQALADSIPILYGGSVKASNAAELFSQPNVDGGLVGGASLHCAEFTSIIQQLRP